MLLILVHFLLIGRFTVPSGKSLFHTGKSKYNAAIYCMLEHPSCQKHVNELSSVLHVTTLQLPETGG